MTQTAKQYGKVLYDLQIPRQDVLEMEEVFGKVPALLSILNNPALEKRKKHTVIEKIFPDSLHNFMKTVSDHRRTEMIPDMVSVWKACVRQEKGVLSAALYCVHEPDENQLLQLEAFVKKTYGAEGVEMSVEYRPALIGGFVLRVGDREYDWSLQGRIRQLEQRLVRR